MRTFAKEPDSPQRGDNIKSSKTRNEELFAQDNAAQSILHLQRTLGNQAVLKILRRAAEGRDRGSMEDSAEPLVNHDHDEYERQADHVASRIVQDWRSSGIPSADAGSPGAGGRLPETVRAGLEQSFGRDLGAVRLHTDPATAEVVAGAGARALTMGSDIAFAPKQYEPANPDGLRLLTHEIAHVAQQGRAPLLPGRSGRSFPSISPRPATIRTAQASINVDPAKFSGPGARQLGMDLAQFKAHIAGELSAVTGLTVNFQGNQLRMTGDAARAASNTAVNVLRLALDSPDPYYIDPVPGPGGTHIQASGRRGIELGTGPFPRETLRAMRRGIIIIHEFAHVFSAALAQPGHAGRLRALNARYQSSLAGDRLTGTFTTEELGEIQESQVGTGVSQEVIPVQVANRVRSELGLGIRRLTYRTPIMTGGAVAEFAQFLVEGSRPPLFIYQRLSTGELLVSGIDYMQEGARAGRPATAGPSDLRPIASFPQLRQHLI